MSTLASASGFAATMLVGACACFLHGLFPFAFQKSGSRRIIALHERMVANRHRNPRAEPSPFLGVAEGDLVSLPLKGRDGSQPHQIFTRSAGAT